MCGMASWQQWNDLQQDREHKPWSPVCNAIRQLVTIDQSTTHTSASCSLPAASAMDTIRACPECQEPDPSSSLSHRERVLQHFSTVPGLGPVDLVLCIKEAKGGFGEQKTSSFFHQVVGYDVCSTASLAAYFSDLCSNSEQVGFFSGLFTSVQWNITQCVYCCYDAFSRLDVRCHMAIPGGVIAYAVDCKGQRYEMTSAHWKQVSISAFLRHEYYNPAVFRGVPAVVQHQAMRTPDAEESVLDSILDLYYDLVPPQVVEMLRPGGQRGGAKPEDSDPLLAAVLHHFKRRRVMEGAVEFFTQVASLHAPAVVQLCAALSALGRTDDALQACLQSSVSNVNVEHVFSLSVQASVMKASRGGDCSCLFKVGQVMQVLRSNALRAPQDINIICALATAEASAGCNHEALLLARHALLLAPKSTTALLCMAHIQATCGAPALAVLAMHLVVPPSDQAVLFKRIYPFGLPPYTRITVPECMPWSADMETLSTLEEEVSMPQSLRATSDWRPFVQQLCGIQDGDTNEEEPPKLAPEVFTDQGSLKTSVVYLLPHISAAKYNVACTCIRAMGVENFALTLQALARNATDNGALARGRRRASKRGSLSQPSSITLEPVPEQAASVDISQELSADLTQPSVDEPMHRIAEGSGVSASTPTSENARGNSDLQEPFPGHVQPGEVGDGYDDSSAPAAVGSQPADLSYMPTDLIPNDQIDRHQGDLYGHPVGEGAEQSCGKATWDHDVPVDAVHCHDGQINVPDRSQLLPRRCGHCACTRQRSTFASGVCEGVKRSDSSNQHLLRRNDSSIVLQGESSGSIDGDDAKEVVTHLSWDDPSQAPQASSLRKDAPRFASANRNHALSSTASRKVQIDAENGSESPVGVLREALRKYENGSADITVECLARLQLRAQEYATRAGPASVGRLKRRRRLPATVARQINKTSDSGHEHAAGLEKGADTGPVATSIVNFASLSSTAHRLQHESSLKKSIRQCEAQRILAALLDAASAPPGVVHHLSHHCAAVIAALFRDLDAAALVHTAAVEVPQNSLVHGCTAAAEAVKSHEDQFLTFRHRPLNSKGFNRAMIENASVGDWLAWAACCERLKCLKHSEYAYMRALSSVHPHRCLTAHLSLARLLAAEADIHTVFDHLTEVLLHLDFRKEQQQGHATPQLNRIINEGQVPSAVVRALVTVTASWGMAAVQGRLEKGVGQYHPSIEAVVEQAFEWGTDGCDM